VSIKFNQAELVLSAEHPKAVGQILRVTDLGVTVEFTTPPNEKLPYGHIIIEFWSIEDAQTFVKISSLASIMHP
jgi:hypothetical protein